MLVVDLFKDSAIETKSYKELETDEEFKNFLWQDEGFVNKINEIERDSNLEPSKFNELVEYAVKGSFGGSWAKNRRRTGERTPADDQTEILDRYRAPKSY